MNSPSLPAKTSELPTNLRSYRRTVLISYLGLISLFFVNSLLITIRPGITSLVIWMIQVLPLLLFARGLLKNRLRTYAWLSFVILMYFVHAVLAAFNPVTQIMGVIEIVLCSILFIALITYIRSFRAHYNVPL